MLKTLRARLMLSHALPLLIILPIMGILLIYVLETQVVMPNLVRDLEGDARFYANLVSSHPELWQDASFLQGLLGQLGPQQAEGILLLTPEGSLVGSTGLGRQLNETITAAELEQINNGQIVSTESYNDQLKEEVIDITAPVLRDSQVVGIVRLTYLTTPFFENFLRLRTLIGGILLVGLISGLLIGGLLSLSISNPLRRVTQTIYELASGRRSEALQESGPEEVRQLQRTANYLMERLHNLEESRQKLLANLAHELGRPMGAMRAAIQALQRGAKEDQKLRDEILLGMDEEARRLQRLTEDLASLHQQVLGTLELELQTLKVNEWLPGVLQPWEAEARKAGLQWRLNLPTTPLSVQADGDRLAQAVGNLVSNAIKYTPAGGHASVSAGTVGAQTWIEVGDSGLAIPAEEREKIFTPFFRGNQGKRTTQGMGLGLSIARDLVAAHGGRLELENTTEDGNHFRIWLPSLV